MARFPNIMFIKRWFNIGKTYNYFENINLAIDRAKQDGYKINCWEKIAAFRAGQQNLPFEIKKWKRYGDIPEDKNGQIVPSTNHMSGESEYGISVIDEEWENSTYGKFMMKRYKYLIMSRELVSFWGLRVGYGSDNEPVVIPIEKTC